MSLSTSDIMTSSFVLQALQDVVDGKLKPVFNRAVFWSDSPERYIDEESDNNNKLVNAFSKLVEAIPLWKMPLTYPTKQLQHDDSIPFEIKNMISSIYSRAYARLAAGRIFVAVDRARPDRFFRCVELPEILLNQNITSVSMLDRNKLSLTGEPMTKLEWLALQKQRWDP